MIVISLHISLSVVFIIFLIRLFSVLLVLFLHCNLCLFWFLSFMMEIFQKYLVIFVYFDLDFLKFLLQALMLCICVSVYLDVYGYYWE